MRLELLEVDRRGDSKTGSKVTTEIEPCARRLQKDMRDDWFSVYLKNHLNLSVTFPSGYLAMSSLFAFRSFSVVQKFGDKVLCFVIETLYAFNRKPFFVHPSSLLCRAAP